MKKKLLFVFILFFISTLSFSQQVSCVDSATVTYYYHDNNGSVYYSTEIDNYDLDSGKVSACLSAGDSPSTMSNFSCTDGFWKKNILSYNPQGKKTEILKRTGSPNGWLDSERTTFTYDSSGNILTQSFELRNGNSWEQTSLQTWTYNNFSELLVSTEQDFQSGDTINKIKISCNYSGNSLTSKKLETGSGNQWINNKNYLFYYDVNGLRDSVMLQTWDTVNHLWNTVGKSAYYINDLKLADFIIIKPVDVNGVILNDSTYFSIDTLENTLYYYNLSPIVQEPYFLNMTIKKFEYVNNKIVNIYDHLSKWWVDPPDTDLYWYCTGNNLTSMYDTDGYLIKTVQSARCVMPNEYTTKYIYDANHLLVKQTGSLDANSRTDEYVYDFFYSNPDSMLAIVSPFSIPGYGYCRHDSLHPEILTAGGCGNYHYNWSPSTGLSSDTVANPSVVVNDSVLYTITVTDSNGHFATTNFVSIPSARVTISIDSTSCTGCPPTLQATNSPSYSYIWYLNDTIIPGSNFPFITPTTSGNYYVVVTNINSSCTDTSNTIYYLPNLIRENIIDESIVLKPNPSSGLTQLTINSATNEQKKINLFSISGKYISTVFDGTRKYISLMLNAEILSPGVYILSIESEKSLRHIRWVVQ